MTRSCFRATSLALALVAGGLSPAFAEEHGGGGGEGGGSSTTSAFAPGEHELQLPPLWVPVKGLHGRTPGVAGYRAVTIRLTSQHDGITAMCYRLPYLTEAYLLAFNRDPISVTRDGHLDFGKMETVLLNESARIAGPSTVKHIELIDGTPRASKTNQDMLVLCR